MDSEKLATFAVKSETDVMLQVVSDILDADDGKSFEEKREEAIKFLSKKKDHNTAEILVDLAMDDDVGKKNGSMFWAEGQPIKVRDGIALRAVASSDREPFLEIQRIYSPMRSMLKEGSYCEMVWKEHVQPKALMCSIIQNSTYIGYCGIKNTAHDPWEIAIELYPEATQHGIGPDALAAMLNTIRDRLGKSEFRVRVDPGNKSSQKMFERLGAVPNGISSLFLQEEELLQKCEEDNLHLIDESVILLAKKFGVEPRKLLSHVLEYKLFWR